MILLNVKKVPIKIQCTMQLAIIKKRKDLNSKDSVGSDSKLHMIRESRYIAYFLVTKF